MPPVPCVQWSVVPAPRIWDVGASEQSKNEDRGGGQCFLPVTCTQCACAMQGGDKVMPRPQRVATEGGSAPRDCLYITWQLSAMTRVVWVGWLLCPTTDGLTIPGAYNKRLEIVWEMERPPCCLWIPMLRVSRSTQGHTRPCRKGQGQSSHGLLLH